ncbi:uncharacterized protein LOC134864444 isoform X3 [Eleginops maclovinus]|uniref:uncharacterized protein LOC134864444 isoform X3 n=1 Tax=Eleginops maclovinus TaxID=56733 RepID=UPI00308019AA
MVQCQLFSLEQLMSSGFGRPFPRHGLQLLFWFANHCVTCEVINFVLIMKLVSDCQPERGVYGFHLFGNMEELLPVLNRKRKSKRQEEDRPYSQVLYFEVGNLNTETYPGSADLPSYVRENYDLEGNIDDINIDRIIVSYQLRTRVVETVYVTEHDRAVFGMFSADRTFEINPELIQDLQSPQLDLTTFLTQTSYWGDIQVVQTNDIDEIHYPEPSVEQMFNIMQNYWVAKRQDLGFFSEAFNQQIDVSINPYSDDQQGQYFVDVTSHNSHFVACNSEVQRKNKKRKASKRANTWRQTYWLPDRGACIEDFDSVKKKKGGGGFRFIKILLSAGVLCLAAKCFSWLRSCWGLGRNDNILQRMPWRTPSYHYHSPFCHCVFPLQ